MQAINWTPHEYQKVMISWLVKHPNAMLAVDPGLGKTSCTLAAFCALKKSGAVNKALIVAPLRVVYNVWSASGEIGKWSQFKDLKICVLHGKEKEANLDVDADLFLINYDALQWLTDKNRIAKLIKQGVDLLVFDEISKMKHTKSKRFRAFKPWLGRFKRRWGLTGSPASNGLMDLFGQVYCLDLGKSLGSYITQYRNTYFTPCGFGGFDWQLIQDGDKLIYKAIKDLAISMRASDHLDLPDLIEQDLFVSLDDASQKYYDQMQDDLIMQVKQGLVSAANAAVASGKCRQIASGGVYVDVEDPTIRAPRKVEHLHNAKTEALLELVGELQGQPLLVSYEFDHDLDRIKEALPQTQYINGSVTAKESNEIIEKWNEGKIQVLAVHPAAVAHGLNLQAGGCHIAFYSLTWNQEYYTQLIARLHRQGSTFDRVIVHRIIARKTIDEIVAKALKSKTRVQDALLDAIKTGVVR